MQLAMIFNSYMFRRRSAVLGEPTKSKKFKSNTHRELYCMIRKLLYVTEYICWLAHRV
jgi:hypothetical protein